MLSQNLPRNAFDSVLNIIVWTHKVWIVSWRGKISTLSSWRTVFVMGVVWRLALSICRITGFTSYSSFILNNCLNSMQLFAISRCIYCHIPGRLIQMNDSILVPLNRKQCLGWMKFAFHTKCSLPVWLEPLFPCVVLMLWHHFGSPVTILSKKCSVCWRVERL